MNVPSPITWTASQKVTSAQMNSNVRDPVNFFLGVPKAVLKQTSGQSIANATETALTWNAEDLDNDNAHSVSTNTSRFTCQTAGWYLATAHVTWSANTTGVRWLVHQINGFNTSRYGLCQVNAVGTGDTALGSTTVLHLNANDYAEVIVYQNSGGALSTDIPSNNAASRASYIFLGTG